MLYKARDILDCVVHASDGEVGRIKDVYFDDAMWTLRYFVVDTGGWLSTQEVLLTPTSMRGGGPAGGVFHTDLTRQQVKDSPPVTADMPVSRQYEERLHAYYGWMPYWDLPLYSAPGLYVYPPIGALDPFAMARPERAGGLSEDFRDAFQRRAESGDPHLRNFKEIKGYHIAATDGRIGHVADCLIDPTVWRFTHMVVDPRNWLPGKHVVVDIGFVRDIDWAESQVTVGLSQEDIKAAPPYDPARLFDDQYLAALSAHYQGVAGPRRSFSRSDREAPPPPM